MYLIALTGYDDTLSHAHDLVRLFQTLDPLTNRGSLLMETLFIWPV